METTAKPGFTTTEFWFSIVAALVPILNKVLGWGLDASEVATAIAPAVAYAVGRGLAKIKAPAP